MQGNSSVQKPSSGLQEFLRLLPVVGLLWLFVFIRVHSVENLAYFVDELRHIGRAKIVWSFSDIDISTTPHKFLVYYWIGLFGPPDHLPGWVSRTAVALYTPLGAAGTFILAKTLFSRRVALWSLAVITIFPFMFFYDRLALSDPLASPLVAITAWWSIITLRHPTRRNGAILGLLATFMLIAKVLTGPMLILPIAAALFLSPTPFRWRQPWRPQLEKTWQRYREVALVAAAVLVVIWVIILGFYAIRTLTSNEPSSPIVNPYLYHSAGPLYNLGRVVVILHYLWGAVLVALMAISIGILARRRPYTLLFLLSGILPLWFALVVIAKEFTTRYLTLTGQLWVVLIVGGLWLLKDELAGWLQKQAPGLRVLAWLPFALVIIWMAAFGARFWWTLIDQPLDLRLPDRDAHEYFGNQTGYALRDLMLDVAQMDNISRNSDVPVLVGETRNCSLNVYNIPGDTPLKLECTVYSVRHSDEWPTKEQRMNHINASLAKYGDVYMMIERFDTWEDLINESMINGDLEFLRRYERPFDGVPVELYIVHPRE